MFTEADLLSLFSDILGPLSIWAKGHPALFGVLGTLLMILLFLTRMPVAYVMLMVGFLGFSTLTSVKRRGESFIQKHLPCVLLL